MLNFLMALRQNWLNELLKIILFQVKNYSEINGLISNKDISYF